MPAHPFWQFSLSRYRDPAVATACLTLQDRLDADVNLLLWCLWLGAQGQALDRATLAQADAHCARWRRWVITPLRRLRRRLKGGPQGIYRLAKRLELWAEARQQTRLWRLAQTVPTTTPRGNANPSAAAHNLAIYRQLLTTPTPADLEVHWQTLLTGTGDNRRP